jgi:hypothetical protein
LVDTGLTQPGCFDPEVAGLDALSVPGSCRCGKLDRDGMPRMNHMKYPPPIRSPHRKFQRVGLPYGEKPHGCLRPVTQHTQATFDSPLSLSSHDGLRHRSRAAAGSPRKACGSHGDRVSSPTVPLKRSVRLLFAGRVRKKVVCERGWNVTYKT